MKKISCGVIIYNDNSEFLGCIPFGKKDKLDLPKGEMEDNESTTDCAIREVFEETGIVIDKRKLFFIGKYKYSSSKDLLLFLYNLNFDIDKLECISTFEFYGKKVPEVVGYKKVNLYDFDYIEKYFYKSLGKLLLTILNTLDI